jgi:hypothetical protein
MYSPIIHRRETEGRGGKERETRDIERVPENGSS